MTKTFSRSVPTKMKTRGLKAKAASRVALLRVSWEYEGSESRSGSRTLRHPAGAAVGVWHLGRRAVEAGGERVALEPVVDGDVELAGSSKALHLVEPAGAGTSSRVISGVLGSSRAISPPGGTSRRAGRARSPPAPGRVVASWLGGGEAGARAGLGRRDATLDGHHGVPLSAPLGSSRPTSTVMTCASRRSGWRS